MKKLNTSKALMQKCKSSSKTVHSLLHWANYSIGISLLASISIISGCSVGGLFSGSDQSVLNSTIYRKVNRNCGFKSSSAEIDVPTLRGLVKCLNANGAMPRVQALIDNVSDSQLDTFVQVSNKYILSDKKRLFEIQSTHNTLKDKGIVADAMQKIGKLLKGQVLSNALSLLKDGAFVDAKEVDPSAQAEEKVLDPDLLIALELLSSELTRSNVEKTQNTLLSLIGTRSAGDLYQGLMQIVPKQNVGSEYNHFQFVVDSLFQYIQSEHNYSCNNKSYQIKNDLFESVLNGDLFKAFDETFGIQATRDANGEDPLKDKVAKVALVLQSLAVDHGVPQGELIRKMSSAFYELNDPISCFKGAIEISNPPLLIIKEMIERKAFAEASSLDPAKELANYVIKENPLNFTFLQTPVCKLPAQKMKEHYPALKELVLTSYHHPVTKTDHSLILPMTELMDTLYTKFEKKWRGCDGKSQESSTETYHPMAMLLLHALGDKGIQIGVPFLSEISQRDIWTHLFLLVTSTGQTDRTRVEDFSKYMVRPRKELKDKSIADIMLNAISRSKDSGHLIDFIFSLRSFAGLEPGTFESALGTLRNTLLINDVEPLMSAVREIGSEARKNSNLFKTAFQISGKIKGAQSGEVKDYVADAADEISEMATDGRLLEVVEAVLAINAPYANQVRDQVKIHELPIPPFVAERRHDYAQSDLIQYSGNPPNTLKLANFNIAAGCDKLDFSASLIDSTGLVADQAWENFLQCLNRQDVAAAIENLRSQRLERDSGKSLFDLSVDVVKKIAGGNLETKEIEQIKNDWMAYYSKDSKRFDRILDGMPFWIHGCPSSGSVLKPLIRVAGSLVNDQAAFDGGPLGAREDLDGLADFGARVLRKDNFPRLLTHLDEILSMDANEVKKKYQKDKPKLLDASESPDHLETRIDPFTERVLSRAWNGPLENPFNEQFVQTLKQWVLSKECHDLPKNADEVEAELENRVVRILNEARDNYNNWEIVPTSKKGWSEPRRKWEFAEFRKWLEPVVKKFSDPNLSSPNRQVLDAQLDFLRYFSLPHQVSVENHDWKGKPIPQFSPDWLINWFYDRAIDYRPITYFYPGETKPRVRIVNTLDLFELVTINADFLAPKPISKNLGLEDLAIIGKAWGDVEDPNQWPIEIQEEYKRTKVKPFTLLQAVQKIKAPYSKEVYKPNGFLDWVNGITKLQDLYSMSVFWVGLPSLPQCTKNVIGQPEVPEPYHVSAKIGEKLFGRELQARLYNIWQVIDVLHDNSPNKHHDDFHIPSPGNGYRKSYANGMEFFRNLFFQLYYSSPSNHTGFVYDIDRAKDGNNLTVISYTIRIGALRQIGRMIQNVRRDDPGLKDLFYSLLHSIHSPHMKEVLQTMFKTPTGQELFWNLLRELFGVVNESDSMDVAQMKENLFYAISMMNQIDPWEPSLNALSDEDLSGRVLSRFKEVIDDPTYKNFLSFDRGGFIKDVLTSKRIGATAMKAYYKMSEEKEVAREFHDLMDEFLKDEDASHKSRLKNAVGVAKAVYDNPEAVSNLKTFLSRMDQLIDSAEYKNLDLSEALRPVLLFFEESSRDFSGANRCSEDRALARKLRFNLAEILESRDLTEFFIYAKDHPEKFDQLLDTLSQSIGKDKNDGIKFLLKDLHGKLSASKY